MPEDAWFGQLGSQANGRPRLGYRPRPTGRRARLSARPSSFGRSWPLPVGRAVLACSVVIRAGWLIRQAIASGGKMQGRALETDESPSPKVEPQNEERGALFYELIKILFCYA